MPSRSASGSGSGTTAPIKGRVAVGVVPPMSMPGGVVPPGDGALGGGVATGGGEAVAPDEATPPVDLVPPPHADSATIVAMPRTTPIQHLRQNALSTITSIRSCPGLIASLQRIEVVAAAYQADAVAQGHLGIAHLPVIEGDAPGIK